MCHKWQVESSYPIDPLLGSVLLSSQAVRKIALLKEDPMRPLQDWVMYSWKALSHFFKFEDAAFLTNSPSENSARALRFWQDVQESPWQFPHCVLVGFPIEWKKWNLLLRIMLSFLLHRIYNFRIFSPIFKVVYLKKILNILSAFSVLLEITMRYYF